jgi:hypothetical protein
MDNTERKPNMQDIQEGAYPKKRRRVFAERIFGITYHISSSPYLSEDIRTQYTDSTNP